MKNGVWVASLEEEQISEYERLHLRIPDAIRRQLADKGYTRLDITRCGLTLVMVWEIDESLIIAERQIDEHAESDWDFVTGACFAESWQAAPVIFSLQEQFDKWGNPRK